jgi:hypothetical protein
MDSAPLFLLPLRVRYGINEHAKQVTLLRVARRADVYRPGSA